MRLPFLISLVAAVLTGSVAPTVAGPPLAPRVPTQSSVETLALEWFARMQAGQIDRGKLAADYSAELTDDAVQATSRYLKEYDYGAPPTGAQVLNTRTIRNQTFYVVKLLFPRGDAAHLMIAFDSEGKITGISLLSMAGD